MVVSIRNPAVIAAINQEIGHLGKSTGNLDFWVSLTGDDDNPGTSLLPFATAEKAESMFPFYMNHVGRIHFGAGVHDLPPRGHLMSSRVLDEGYLHLLADVAFDPAVFTTVLAGVCDAGTGQYTVTVVGGGLTPDAHIREFIEFTDGAAQGLRQSIRVNTATEISPVRGFDVVDDVKIPAPGDNFILRSSNCTLRAPAGPSDQKFYLLAKRQVGARDTSTSGSVFSGGLIFEGFNLACADVDDSWNQFSVTGDRIYFYGCNTGLAADIAIFGMTILDGLCLVGIGLNQIIPDYSGWGFTTAQRFMKTLEGSSAYLDGFFIAPGDINPAVDAKIKFRGGRYGRISSLARNHIEFSRQGNGHNKNYVDTPGVAFLQLSAISSPQSAKLGDVEVTMGLPIISAGQGSVIQVAGGGSASVSSPGNVVMQASLGGAIILNGTSAGIGAGSGALDWEVDGVVFDPEVHLANPGDVVTSESLGGSIGTSSITRVT